MEEKEIEITYLKKVMKENFPNLVKEINMKVQDAQRVPEKLDPRRNTPRHIVIKLPKVRDERILKAAGGKETVTYKGVPISLYGDFSKETLQTRRGWKEVFQVMKGKRLHPRLLSPGKLSFTVEGQIQYLTDKVKLKESIITNPYYMKCYRDFSKK